MSLKSSISNTEDVIDSRAVIERVQYLENEKAALEDEVETAQGNFDAARTESIAPDSDDVKRAESALERRKEELQEWEDDWSDELSALQALANEAEGYSDWSHGTALIRDSYFTEYAEELASDITDYRPDQARWPYTCIDWEKAADELKEDYVKVDFDGVDYWVRAT